MPDTIEALQRRIAELEQLVYVPGRWKCAVCSFELFQHSISAQTGAVSERDDPGEKCPNCHVPLWRVTERDVGFELAERCEQAIIECAEVRTEKDGAYAERNKLVRLLASLFPSGIRKTEIEGWDPEWHWCVYIDLPSGQVSWHIHESELPLFEGLRAYLAPWDGHDTEEKYRRVAAESKNRCRAIITWDAETVDEASLRADILNILNEQAVYPATMGVTVTQITALDRGLVMFAREAIDAAFSGGSLDGGAIQELALRFGLLAEIPFDPVIHKDPDGCATVGDPWYVLAGAISEGAYGDVSEDSARLNWLDQVNTRTNARNGSRYGWQFDMNHKRAALSDCHVPYMMVRDAIDAARFPDRKYQIQADARRRDWQRDDAQATAAGKSVTLSPGVWPWWRMVDRTPSVAGMLELITRLHVEEVLSEGQVAKATGLHRISVRHLADELPEKQRGDGND